MVSLCGLYSRSQKVSTKQLPVHIYNLIIRLLQIIKFSSADKTTKNQENIKIINFGIWKLTE